MAPAIFFAAPRSAEAGPVIVIDIVQQLKDFALDTAVKAIAKIIVNELIHSMINWIRTGDAGNTLFVTNFDQYLFDAADNAAGLFLQEYLSKETYSLLCTPFRAQVFRALAQGYPRYPSSLFSFGSLARCSLTDVVENVEDFYLSFENGGWAAWFAQARPANNYYGLQLLGRDESRKRQIRASTETRHDFQTGSGFIADKICLEKVTYTFVDDDNPGVEETRTECAKTFKETVGSAVKAELESVVGADIAGLYEADEISEIIFLTADALLFRILHDGGIDAPDSSTSGTPLGLYNPNESQIVISGTYIDYANTGSNPTGWHCEGDGGGGSVTADGGSSTTGTTATGGSSSASFALSNEQDCDIGDFAGFAIPIPCDPVVDPACSGSPTSPECSDSVDNDGDTFIDYPADPECTSLDDTSESAADDLASPQTCTNLNQADPSCPSGFCSGSGTCSAGGCTADAGACTTSGTCCSNYCSFGACTPVGGSDIPGTGCDGPSHCKSPLVCINDDAGFPGLVCCSPGNLTEAGLCDL